VSSSKVGTDGHLAGIFETILTPEDAVFSDEVGRVIVYLSLVSACGLAAPGAFDIFFSFFMLWFPLLSSVAERLLSLTWYVVFVIDAPCSSTTPPLLMVFGSARPSATGTTPLLERRRFFFTRAIPGSALVCPSPYGTLFFSYKHRDMSDLEEQLATSTARNKVRARWIAV
jgi:hypothetical protein